MDVDDDIPSLELSGQEWERVLRREKLRQLVDQTPVVMVATLLNAILLAAIVAGQVPNLIIAAWTTTVITIALFLLTNWWRNKHRDRKLTGSRHGLRKSAIYSAIFGIVWAISIPLFHPFLTNENRIFLFLVLAGMAAGGTINLAPVRQASFAFVAPIFLTLMPYVFFGGELLHIALGVLLGFFLLTTILAQRAMPSAATAKAATKYARSQLSASYDAADRAETHLREAIEAMSDAFILYDEDDRVVLFNSKHKALFSSFAEILKPGARYEDLLRKQYESGQFESVKGRVEEALAERLHSHHRTTGEHVQDFADGRTIRMTERRTSSGGIVAVRADITDLTEARQRAEDGEERFRSVVESMPVALILKNMDGNIQLVNPVFEKNFDTVGVDAGGGMEFVSSTMAADLAEIDKEVLEHRQVVQKEIELTLPDGNQHSMLVTKFPVLDAAGDISGIGDFWVDVSAQKSAEEQLRQAQKMEAVGQLTGGVAHDFNNLLAVIVGNAELLKVDNYDNSENREKFLAAIFRAANRGAELTNRLLAFSRLQPLQPKAVDVTGLVTGMGDLMRRTLGETVQIEILCADNVPLARVDPGQLENAILNLAINARDAVKESGNLRIQTGRVNSNLDLVLSRTELPAGEYVSVEVADTGHGMADDVLNRVFDPFFTTKEVGEGSGLGLSMVYGFAQQSGGHVDIESEIGKGTIVRLYLPIAESADRSTERQPIDLVPTGRGELILVIEDDPDMRVLSVQILQSLNYQVVNAVDATSARAILSAETVPDLILSDVVLPGGISGPELAQELKAEQPGLKFVFMSGYPTEAIKNTNFLNSDPKLLQKPFHRRQLAEALRDELMAEPVD